MKRLSWSKLFTLAALVSLGIVTHGVATAQRPSIQISGSGAGRTPDTTQQVGARVPATQAPGQFKAWEGFVTTNYLNTEQYVFTPPSASTAAGPVNIITIVNRRIAIYDNPNAILQPAPGGPTLVSDVTGPRSYVPTGEALLDTWLGQNVLVEVDHIILPVRGHVTHDIINQFAMGIETTKAPPRHHVLTHQEAQMITFSLSRFA